MFNEDYYLNVIKEFGYNSFKFNKIDFTLPGINTKSMRNLWLCSYNIDHNFNSKSKVLFTTGIGLSGTPHLGTISQITRAIKLSEYNDVQIVLGDVDAYTGRKSSWESTQLLNSKYRNFIKNMGFKGIVRDQSTFDSNVYVTHSKISKYFSHEIATKSEEDLHELYVSNGKVENDMTFNRKYSLSLMCADFIDPLINDDYDEIVVFLGLDEHKYVQAANKVINSMSNEFPQVKEKNIRAMYSPLISGFNGFPKMSKSFPESSINIEDSMVSIEQKIINDNFLLKDNSTVTIQLMKALGNYTDIEIDNFFHIMESNPNEWRKEKEKFINKLMIIKESWSNV
ncbi:hypothetical protein DOK78_002029 [Enterococcus sp. DIV2402]|uniref:Tryptophan--tRNA ligase n=1 Tax=Candidatus Enterococcus lowellii TaxID=2230877 RepID=A0ABZ2SSH9_9ENTE|nr:hypothetical protein [Enterococcus sp. DIV2402]